MESRKHSFSAGLLFVMALVVIGCTLGLRPAPKEEPVPATKKWVQQENFFENWRHLYDAKVTRVVDGDTIDVEITLGLDVFTKLRLRLYGINAPEIRGESKVLGKAATEFLKSLIDDKEVIIMTIRDRRGKYGRHLAKIYLEEDTPSVNQLMVENGHAVKYMED